MSRLIVYVPLLAGIAAAAHAADPRGYMLGAACLACHGNASSGERGIPPIRGRDADELRTALLAFRDGTRDSTIMQRLARGYDVDEIALIANWLEAGGHAP